MAAALAGCGEEGSRAPAPAQVTKPQYIAAGDEICAEGDRELAREGKRTLRQLGSEDPAGGEVERFAEETVIPVTEMRIADLRALEPPAGDEQQVAEIFDAAERSLDEIRDDPSLIEKAEQVFEPASRLAAAYGFMDCAGRGSAIETLTGDESP